jgi:3',5'-cyclic AMP phosphodiesterase CpdA
MISRRSLLTGFAGFTGSVALSASPLLSIANSGRRGFRFVHLCDIHIQPELGATDGTNLAIQKLLQLRPRPDFVITGGDHVMDVLSVPGTRADLQFKLLNEAFKPLEMPVHHIVGNHDCFGWSSSSPITETDPRYGKKLFEEKVIESSTYRSFDYGGVHFILLDSIQTQPNRDWTLAVDDHQLSWLQGDLAKTPLTTPVIVVIHGPVLSAITQLTAKTLTAPDAGTICSNGHEVRDLWKAHNVKAVLQAHTHIVESVDFLGVHYVTGGAVCGEWWKGPRLGVIPEGFMVYDVTGSDLKYTYVPTGWKAVGA